MVHKKIDNPYAKKANDNFEKVAMLPVESIRDLMFYVEWRKIFDSSSISVPHYVNALHRMYKTNNLEYIRNYVSKERYDLYEKELATLEDYGLRKEIEFHFDEENPKMTGIRTSNAADQIYNPGMYGSYKESYYDQNNHLVHEIYHDYAAIYISEYKTSFSDLLDETRSNKCFNCGGELERDFERYHCPQCHTDYESEASVWIVTDFWTEKAKRPREKSKEKGDKIKKFFGKIANFLHLDYLIPILFLASIFIAIIDFERVFSGPVPWFLQSPYKYIPGFIFIVLPLALMFLGLTLGYKIFTYCMDRYYDSLITIEDRIQEEDPYFSPSRLSRHIYDIGAKGVLAAENQEVLSSMTPLVNVKKFYRKKDHGREGEYIDVEIEWQYTILTRTLNGIKIKDIEKSEKLSLVRDAGVKTNFYYIPQQFTCPNCGSHSKILSQSIQTCEYCRTETELRTIDWQVV